MIEAIVVGAGFSGAVIARHLAVNKNKKVLLLDKRNHIAGNMYDKVDENGIIVQQYGPHIFHTNNERVYNYIKQFGTWEKYFLECMVFMNGKYTNSPFNFKTIDDYYEKDKAELLKERISKYYNGLEKATIVEMLNCEDEIIRGYAKFLFDNDYSLYTAKQWGISPSEIDISVLKRVPVLFSYNTGYFDDLYQCMPVGGFTNVIEDIINHPNIEIKLNTNVKDYLEFDLKDSVIKRDGTVLKVPVVYTGALDELSDYKFGLLPYRSLYFEYKTENIKSYQKAPVVAYPQAKSFTRITEYNKLPKQESIKTTIAVEYPIQYNLGGASEPYYPIITEDNQNKYNKYKSLFDKIDNIFICGRLADYKYYNMDQVINRALEVCDSLDLWFSK
ncbi:UDP-galactopyranose mutase [Anaerocolumna sp. AGMB13020]|uniref:UDP-galactopyranose mutase n=1 Tax=Anaerocolumna sp. AGMB13020 TaxID=3081750 RepID=UPI002954B965|nr:UDP-galactopyranose mutase [Anaerocolumna sp. AGMB13020]WOO35454.1 UDP-galactopyranose mutase [Anaerocolumna sp. AGMB13020]